MEVDSYLYCSYNISPLVGSLFEWDDAKRQANLAKHGVDFAAIDAFDWETALIDSDTRQSEPRWVATGFIGSHCCPTFFSTTAASAGSGRPVAREA